MQQERSLNDATGLPGSLSSASAERFLTDTKRLVKRHMEDPHHVITDEEMQNIRVGLVPPVDGEREGSV